jgi:hypothetical protein
LKIRFPLSPSATERDGLLSSCAGHFMEWPLPLGEPPYRCESSAALRGRVA